MAGTGEIQRIAGRADALRAGSLIKGRYEVRALLGGGELGFRYACADRLENRSVMLREYFPKTLAERAPGTSAVSPKSGEAGGAFIRGADAFYEVYTALQAVVGSTDVEDVRDCFFENGTAYAVGDLYEGVTLKDYLTMRERPLSEGELAYLADALSDALIVVHSLNLVHGDIRAENVFIKADGTAKLIDFGAPRFVATGKRVEDAPETDVYALGRLMYYAATGRQAPQGAVTEAEAQRLPPPVRDTVLRMLACSARAGFASILEIKHAINCLDVVRVRPAVPGDLAERYEERCAQRADQARKNKRIAVCFGLAALLLIGLMIWLLARR